MRYNEMKDHRCWLFNILAVTLTVALIQAPLAWAWPGLTSRQALRQWRRAEYPAPSGTAAGRNQQARQGATGPVSGTPSQPSLGDEIVRALKEVVFPGTEAPEERPIVVYGGDVVHRLVRYLAQSGEFRVIKPAPSEAILGDVAFGLAQLQGIAVVIATYNVGTQPVLIELSKALNEGLPVIVIGGAPPLGPLDWHHTTTSPLAKRPDRTLDLRIAKALGIPVIELGHPPFWKFWVSPAQQFQDALKTAVKTQRPVFIRMRSDLLDQPTRPARPDHPARRKLSLWDQVKLSRLARRTFEQLQASRQPALHVGEGVPRGLAQLVEEVSDELGIFTTVSWGARGLLREDLPTYGGPYLGEMTTETPATRDYMEGADLVLQLGTRRIPTYLETGVGTLRFPSNTISVWASERYPQGQDIEFFLRRLLELARSEGYRRTVDPQLAFANQLRTTPETFEELCSDPPTWATIPRTFGYFNYYVAQKPHTYLIDPSTVLFATVFMPTKGPEAIRGNWNYEQMGVSAGQAIASVVATDRIPIVLTGDGGYAMKGAQAVIELVRLNGHAIVIVFEDRSLSLGKSSRPSPDEERALYETHSERTDLAASATAQGAQVHRVQTNEVLVNALTEAEGHPGVHVIFVPVDPTRATPPSALDAFSKELQRRGILEPALPTAPRALEPLLHAL